MKSTATETPTRGQKADTAICKLIGMGYCPAMKGKWVLINVDSGLQDRSFRKLLGGMKDRVGGTEHIRIVLGKTFYLDKAFAIDENNKEMPV
jgi:hypothetical protein